MAEKTYEEGRILGRLETLENVVSERGTSITGLRMDMNGMGDSIREAISEAIGSLKRDIGLEIAHQIRPVAIKADFACKELQGNGQPGLIKQFSSMRWQSKANWTLTSSMLLTIIAMAMRVWVFVEPKV